MQLRKFRWSKVYESSEEELIAFLQSRGITAEALHIAAVESVTDATNSHQITLWCAEGSFTVTTGAQATPLQTGDALRLPANTSYKLTGGIAGGICYRSSHNAPIALS